MSSKTEEIMRVCEALPADKQSELADFAHFLLTRQDDEAWERLIAYPQARPRLDTFLRDSAAEGEEPLEDVSGEGAGNNTRGRVCSQRVH